MNAKISVLTFIKCPHVACTSNLVKKKIQGRLDYINDTYEYMTELVGRF